jgi:iron uptake system component EfeO
MSEARGARRGAAGVGLLVALAVGLVLSLGGCGRDDGAGVRSTGGGSGSGTGSPGSGSATGLAGQDLSGSTSDPQVLQAMQAYKTWVIAEVEALVADTRRFTDAVRAGNLREAKGQFAPSRVRWERIEPIAGLVEEIDGKVDARVDDFEGVDDPTFTGWHRIEYHLWELGSTKGTKGFADQLDADIATLNRQIKTLEFPPAAVALGPAELIEEVSQGKITGEEDRYSRTDLWDFDANVDGSRKLFELLTPALRAKDAALVDEITAGFDDVQSSLSEYSLTGGGFRPYPALVAGDKQRMQAQLAALSEKLSRIPGVLGLK